MTEAIVGCIAISLSVVLFITINVAKAKIGWSFVHTKEEGNV